MTYGEIGTVNVASGRGHAKQVFAELWN